MDNTLFLPDGRAIEACKARVLFFCCNDDSFPYEPDPDNVADPNMILDRDIEAINRGLNARCPREAWTGLLIAL